VAKRKGWAVAVSGEGKKIYTEGMESTGRSEGSKKVEGATRFTARCAL